MKRLLLLITFINISLTALGQQRDLVKIADSIRAEAEVLYRSEFASWYGTDVFVEKCAAIRPRSQGYLSYDTGTGLVNIFYSKESTPKVLATISFAYDFNAANYKLDTTVRNFNETENDLFKLRKAAIVDIEKDTLYKHYNNTNLNPVPIINNGKRMVYMLTGPKINDVVIFGNDYLLNFDNNNNLVSKKMLHKNIIPIETNNKGEFASHSHLPETGDFITATDICTLMLYQKSTTWKQHYVLSKNYISLWDCGQNKLVIITREAWNKINEHQRELKNTPK